MASELTAKQRAAMDALQAARSAGLGLSAYAKAHGLNEAAARFYRHATPARCVSTARIVRDGAREHSWRCEW